MAEYLVTGGCGFIGSHLVEALLAAGHRVRVLDDLSTGKRSNIAAASVALTVADVSDPAVVREAMAGVDGCFHLAAVASVERSNKDWIGTHRVNLTGTIAVLDAARTARGGSPAPVVYASSAAIYGANPDLPLSETARPDPLTAYGADKLGCELHARVAGHVHGVPTAGFRFFNVYGPRQDPHSPYSGVISIFAARLKAGQGLTLHGDGLQTRDFIYVSDIVRHLTAGMAAASLQGPVFNACTGRAVSVKGMAETMASVLGVPLMLEYGPARAGDIRDSLGDPGKAAAVLDVTAAVPLDRGLAALFAGGC